MAVISTGSFPKALWPGIEAWFGAAYDEYPQQWKQCFEVKTSKQQYEEDAGFSGMGLAPLKAEGSAIQYDSMKQSYVKRYTMLSYAIAYMITREERDDNLYGKLSIARTRAAGYSMNATIETVAANVYNRAFNASFTGGDGVSLLNTAHPTAGGSFANKPTNDMDLSELALEDAIIAISDFTNDRGIRIAIKPQQLIIPTSLIFTAKRILNNPNQPDTAERNINALYQLNSIPQGYFVNHYFTNSNAWFIKTSCPEGMKFYMRTAPMMEDDNDFDTKNGKYSCFARFVPGWTDPRGLYGSSGA